MRLALLRAEKSGFPPGFPLDSDTVISPLFRAISGYFRVAVGTKLLGAKWSIAMATILTRKRADGPRFTARIRITRDGEELHRESRTFPTKAAAKEWAKRREVELEDPKSLIVATAGGATFAALIRWYIDTYETLSQWQRSKQASLEFLRSTLSGKRILLH